MALTVIIMNITEDILQFIDTDRIELEEREL